MNPPAWNKKSAANWTASMSDWGKRRLEEVVRLKRGFDLAGRNRRLGPYPVVGSAGISGWHDEGPIVGPAVVLGRAGASMGVASYCDVGRFWPLNTALFVEDFLGNNPKFVFHLLQITDLTGFNSGSVQPMLNRNYVRNVLVSVPDRVEQDAIAAVLTALDDKIAVNDRIMTVAESLVAALAAEVQGSASVPLSQLVRHVRDQVSPDNFGTEVVAHYSLPAFDLGRVPELVAPSSIKSGKFAITSRCVLVSKLNPSIPRVWDLSALPTIPALASTEFVVLEPNDGVSAHEIWAICSQPSFNESLASQVTGTSNSHQRVRPPDMLATSVVDPRRIPNRVRSQICSLSDKVSAARQESLKLAMLRDYLLARLLSGAIRVRCAQELVEDAT
jgi:type I restriction enzyme S subunit